MLELLLTLWLQTTHPCDTLAQPNVSLDGSSAVMGFCHTQLNDQGKPETGLQFQLSLDGVRIGNYATLTPQTPPNSQGSSLFQFPAIQVGNGNHVFTVWAKNSSGREVESVAYPFAVNVAVMAGPTAAFNLRVTKQ